MVATVGGWSDEDLSGGPAIRRRRGLMHPWMRTARRVTKRGSRDRDGVLA